MVQYVLFLPRLSTTLTLFGALQATREYGRTSHTNLNAGAGDQGTVRLPSQSGDSACISLTLFLSGHGFSCTQEVKEERFVHT